MASMRDIKRRKSSIQSTQQITKAMKLVSTVKLQKAKNRAEQTNPYFQYMYRTVTSMLAKSGTINHPYLKKGESDKKAVVVITSNRGLAGGYNSNIVKLVTEAGSLRQRMPKSTPLVIREEKLWSERAMRLQQMDLRLWSLRLMRMRRSSVNRF